MIPKTDPGGGSDKGGIRTPKILASTGSPIITQQVDLCHCIFPFIYIPDIFHNDMFLAVPCDSHSPLLAILSHQV